MSHLAHPVGLRNRHTNVTNKHADQVVVIGLLSRIGNACGGKREAWTSPPAAGPDGTCPPALADAIWDFQTEWHHRGLLSAPDGVVDPGGHTLRHLDALLNGRCGPVIDDQFRDVLMRIQTDFRGWGRGDQDRACTRILIPATVGAGAIPSFSSVVSDPTQLLTLLSRIKPDINGWDVLPLFEGASAWLRGNRVLSQGCGTPTSPKPNAPAFDPAHEDPCTCSDSVEIGGRCWLNGTVNYGTFGVMVKLCAEAFLPAIFHSLLLRYAEGLIAGYKRMRGNPSDADLPIEWTRATFNGGPGATPPSTVAGNRANCARGCRVKGDIVRWDYVWEPVKRRDASALPEASVGDVAR